MWTERGGDGELSVIYGLLLSGIPYSFSVRDNSFLMWKYFKCDHTYRGVHSPLATYRFHSFQYVNQCLWLTCTAKPSTPREVRSTCLIMKSSIILEGK